MFFMLWNCVCAGFFLGRHVTIILTHAFMLLSAPQCFGVFAYALQTLLLLYYRKRIVDFLTSQYIPHLPVDGVTGEREESPLYWPFVGFCAFLVFFFFLQGYAVYVFMTTGVLKTYFPLYFLRALTPGVPEPLRMWIMISGYYPRYDATALTNMWFLRHICKVW